MMRWTMILLAAGSLLLALWPATLSADPPTHEAGEVKVNTKDGAQMVWVPAGDFLMGMNDKDTKELLDYHKTWKAEWFADEKPQRTVYLDGYWIYKYEVTVAQYRKFCEATGRKMPKLPAFSKDNHPMVNVSWNDASDYARWAGARLPSEAEWEKAARGTDGRRYPWGNTWDGEKCNNITDTNAAGGGDKGKQTSPVGSYPKGMSPYGVMDMAGNAWEWVKDWYDPEYYKNAPAKNPTGPLGGETKIMRGGCWGSWSISIRTSSRHSDTTDARYHDDGGFRCAMSEP